MALTPADPGAVADLAGCRSRHRVGWPVAFILAAGAAFVTTQTVAAFSARLREQVDLVSIDDRDRNEAGSRWPRCSTVVGS
jgi:hypothetical protein